MTELWQMSATDLAALIRAGKASARDAATAALRRLDAVNPAINAVIDHRPDDVLARADFIDAAIKRGNEIGPLAGVPITIKVNVDQAGFATTNGLKLQRDLIAASNNPVVDNLAESRRRHRWPYQHAGVLVSLVHLQPAARRNQEPARSRTDAGRLVRRRGGRGRLRHRAHRPRHRHRRLGALSGLCLRRAWIAADTRAHPGLERPRRSARSVRNWARSPARWRARLPTSASRCR